MGYTITKTFINTGSGVVRKVKVNDKTLIEKVFFTNSIDYSKAKYFDENIRPVLKENGVECTTINNVYEGEIISLIYYEFIDLKKLNDIKKGIIEYSKIFLNLDFSPIIKNAPSSLFNYKSHHRISEKIKDANESLLAEDINVNLIEVEISKLNKVLIHGDLHGNNAYENAIIDWDSFGFYPLGFEAARIYSYYYGKRIKETNFNHWIDVNYRELLNEHQFADFKKCFSYFLYVFMYGKSNTTELNNIQDDLLSYLKENFPNE